MSLKEIQDLIKLMDKSSLSEFHYKTEEYEIKIKGLRQNGGTQVYTSVPSSQPTINQSAQQQAAITNQESNSKEENKDAVQASAPKYLEVRSPMVGTFYRSSSPDKPVLVSVGDTIQKGSAVCIIEAMKLFNEIESEVAGKIVKVMVEDASPVEYDQVLFLVEA